MFLGEGQNLDKMNGKTSRATEPSIAGRAGSTSEPNPESAPHTPERRDEIEGGEQRLLAENNELRERLAELEKFLDAAETRPGRRRRRYRSPSCSTSRSVSRSSSASDSSTEDDEPVPKGDGDQILCDPEPKFVARVFDISGSSVEISRELNAPDIRPRAKAAAPSFIWRNTIRPRQGRPKAEVVIIMCPKLKAVLAKQLHGYPGHYNTQQLKFSSPFLPLIHNWSKLEAEADRLDKDSDDPCSHHLKRLLGAVREKYRPIRSYLDTSKQNEADKVVSFRNLDKLFRPGQFVYASPFNEPQAFLVLSHQYMTSRSRDRVFVLWCWTYSFDGKVFSRATFDVAIERYQGMKKITSLRCYPLEYYEPRSNENIRELLINRGRRYYFINTREGASMMFNHDGDALLRVDPVQSLQARYGDGTLASLIRIGSEIDRRKAPDDDYDTAQKLLEGSKRLTCHGRVMIDSASYRLYGPEMSWEIDIGRRPQVYTECDCMQCQTNEELVNLLRTNYDKFGKDCQGLWPPFHNDEQYMICPPFVKGFDLFKKIWVHMAVKNVHDIRQEDLNSQKTLKKVVLPDTENWRRVKSILTNLIGCHGVDMRKIDGVPSRVRDVIEGKGDGLVILLHGASGVGKTLMAEAIAESTGRPLLKVSVGDIGLNVAEVEGKLEQFFQLASRWKAILLFDEADILLQKREHVVHSFDRNCVVSVFLKVLEYFEGVLILTTNRMKTFDIAVQSRVHLALNFPNMQKPELQKLIDLFLEGVKENEMEGSLIRNWMQYGLTSEGINGREIRNIISAAVDLARIEKRVLKAGDILELWERTQSFKRSVSTETAIEENKTLVRSE